MFCCIRTVRRRRFASLSAAILVCILIYGSLFVLLPSSNDLAAVQEAPRRRERQEDVNKDSVNGHRGILNIKREVANPADVSRQETVKVLSEEITPATTVTSAIGDAGKGSSEHSSVVVSASGTSSEATPSSKALPSPVVAEPHTINAEVKCDGPWPGFSQCSDKMAWMTKNWRTDSCYADNGVDGTTCSFQRYLSEVERWCPPLPNARLVETTVDIKPRRLAVPQFELEPLKTKMAANRKFSWITRRIESHWTKWTAAFKKMVEVTPYNSTRRQIMLYIGALSDKSRFKLAENADKGGPLGELVQWSDLLASVYLLGHQLELATEYDQLKKILQDTHAIGSCPKKTDNIFDVIYIDIVGLKHFKQLAKGKLRNFQCMFRILDSFGTEPQFNFKDWKPEEFRHMKDKGQMWGNWNLHTRQFLTLYPHSPDNSFLGFVVGKFKRNATPPVKKNIAVVYGKEHYMWKGQKPYLDVISKYLDIHATVSSVKTPSASDSALVPGYVTNHGILTNTELQNLLKEAKLFIGLGFPYEGPAPLEAIANGCFFLNPKLSPPINRLNTKFFQGKPTLRLLTSQNPYAEEFIGGPHVYTIDARDMNEVNRVMKNITNQPTPPEYLPFEFTYEGMLERVLVYLQHQDFCYAHQWLTNDTLISRTSRDGKSCKHTCRTEGLVCEPDLFPFLNTKEDLSRHFSCSSVHTEHSYHGPSHHSVTGRCSLQKDHLLLSCVGEADHVTRLCPCRKYRKGQVALCVDCIR